MTALSNHCLLLPGTRHHHQCLPRMPSMSVPMKPFQQQRSPLIVASCLGRANVVSPPSRRVTIPSHAPRKITSEKRTNRPKALGAMAEIASAVLPPSLLPIVLGASALVAALFAVSRFMAAQKREQAKLAEFNLPPGDLGAPALGETLKYVKDMRRFVKDKTKMYGPVWKTHLFGKPTVMLGGPQAVKEFMAVEPRISESALPETFVELTTEYMSLNQSNERLRSSRVNLGKILSPAAMEVYLPEIEASVDALLDKMDSVERFSLSGEVRDWSLDLFLKIFMGLPFTDSLRERFDKFNSGLLGLVPVNCPFTALGKGIEARDSIQKEVLELLSEAEKEAGGPKGKIFALEQLLGSVDEKGEQWTKDRVSVASLLMVWGAYVEVAALVGTLLYILPSQPKVTEQLWQEAKAARAQRGGGGSSPLTFSDVEDSYPYLEAALRETQRYLPPTGPGMRTCEEDLTIAGYTIPAGWVISADPRIGWSMKELYESPGEFNPENFLGKERLPEDFFPGGIGSHQCPGIPLAYFVAKVFMSKFVERFEDCQPVTAEEPEWEAMPIMIIKDEYQMAATPRHQPAYAEA